MTHPALVRSFVAIEISQEARAQIDHFICHAPCDLNGLKWTRPENLHLTLKFLGEMPLSALKPIAEALRGAARGILPFSYRLSGLGAFPSMADPSIVWIGVQEGSQEIVSAAENIASCLEAFGFAPEEKKFQAHLTIARIKDAKIAREVSRWLREARFSSAHPVQVTQLVLFKSILTAQGAVYEPMEKLGFI